MTDAKGLRIPLSVSRQDTIAQIGASMQTIGRSLANAITNEVALDRGDYDIDIVVTVKKVEQ